MQDNIRRINNQQFTKETGELFFEISRLELALSKNEVAEGTVMVCCQGAETFTGYVYSSEYRMQCNRKKISGKKVALGYQFDASGMEYGDEVKGEICIVTGAGQFVLPFEVKIIKAMIPSSMGPVKNLFHFVNLAKTCWKEAVSIFYSDAFRDILEGADKQYLAAYIGLSKYKKHEQNMDEFLLSTNKKQMQTFSLMQERIVFEDLAQECEGELVIERNGWGYTHLEIRVQGDFIRLDQRILTEEDFYSDRCRLPFRIQKERMHAGKNYGKIIITYRDQVLCMEVVAASDIPSGKARLVQKAERAMSLHVIQSYLQYTIGRIDMQEWLATCEEQISKVTALHNGSMLARLYQIHLLLEKGHANEAKWILNHVGDMIEQGLGDELQYAYYLYLTAIYDKTEETGLFTIKLLRELADKHSDDFRFYWLVLKLDSRLMEDRVRVYQELERFFKKGACSPLMYLEAYRILESEPRQFCRIGGFELDILRFAEKYDILSEEMLARVAILVPKQKELRRQIIPILEYGYNVFGGDLLLQELCGLLIQNACTDQKYFVYFEKAVERGLRLTRMYEYYILTRGADNRRSLPKEILMFFAYECNLDYAKKAYVYSCACRQKEELEDIFVSYEKQIPSFICEQIKNERINDDLAYLYDRYLHMLAFDEQLAEHFVKLVFRHKFDVDRAGIRNIIIVHPQLKEERCYPVTGREVYASVYTGDYCVLFEDAQQNRYIPKRKRQLEPLLLYKKIMDLLENYKPDHLGFMLYLCEERKAYALIDGENAHAFTSLLLSPKVSDYYKQQFGSLLLRYYDDNDFIEELGWIIDRINYRNISALDREDFVRYLVTVGKYDLAYDILMDFGFEHVAPKTLARVCDHRLETVTGPDLQVLWLCYEVFKKGRASGAILAYLVDHFDGTMRQMKDVWTMAKEHGIATGRIEKRILTQLLFSDGYLPGKGAIFHSYVENTAGVDDLMRAYVSKESHNYFVWDYVTDPDLFAMILELLRRGEQVSLVAEFALLKHYAQVKEEGGQIEEAIRIRIVDIVKKLLEMRYFFSCFLSFREWIAELQPRVERSYVEYRAHPGCRVIIHYTIAKEGKAVSGYEKEVMNEMYDGYYYKDFCLFFSQQLQYYITVEQDGVSSLVESGEMEKLDVTDVHKESRFAILNDILISHALQDRNTTYQLIREYGEKMWMADAFFKLK
ncbi:MAG: hypothetical protein J6P60_04060 [Lachnospiraceae bacterium]|nr:hypothetical protein [Lachnospiraceae bacterium]